MLKSSHRTIFNFTLQLWNLHSLTVEGGDLIAICASEVCICMPARPKGRQIGQRCFHFPFLNLFTSCCNVAPKHKFGFPRIQRNKQLTTYASFQKESFQQCYTRDTQCLQYFRNYEFWQLTDKRIVKWTNAFLARNDLDVLLIWICKSFPVLLYFFLQKHTIS